MREWDNTLNAIGFEQVDYGRGSAVYGCEEVFFNNCVTATFFWLETLLDMVPQKLIYRFCSQLIGLYDLSKVGIGIVGHSHSTPLSNDLRKGP